MAEREHTQVTDPHRTSCTRAEEGDLIARYLAGKLSDEEAEAFEAHYFECEGCWDATQRALEVRSAFAAMDGERDAAREAPGRSRWATWRPLAAAAVVAGLLVGTWGLVAERGGAPPAEVLRGAEEDFAAEGSLIDGALTGAWPRVPRAEVYRVRLFTADGVLLLEQELSDTTVAVRAASRADEVLYWEVEALDELRQIVARSGLRRLPVRPGTS